MEDAEIIERVKGCEARLVVLTGGEPSLWIDEEFVAGLKRLGKYISVETNGTHSLPSNIDWITLSPKAGMTPGGEKIVIPRADEIKVVNAGQELDPYFDMAQRDSETLMYLQPCYVEDAKERQRIIVDTISKVKRDPRWRLSVQLHRMLNIQ